MSTTTTTGVVWRGETTAAAAAALRLLLLGVAAVAALLVETVQAFDQGTRHIPVKKAEDYTVEDGIAYGTNVGIRSLGCGLGAAIILGTVQFCCCCYCCCGESEEELKTEKKAREKSFYGRILAQMHGSPVLHDGSSKGSSHLNLNKLYIASGAVLVGLVICCSVINATNVALDNSIQSVYDGGEDFVLGAAEKLCNDKDGDDETVCDSKSIGGFVHGAINVTDSVLADAVAFAETIPDTVFAPVDATLVELNRSIDLQLHINQHLNWINDNVSAINSELAGLTNAGNTYVDLSSVITLATVDPVPQRYFDDVNDGLLATRDTISEIRTAQRDLQRTIEDEISQTAARLDGVCNATTDGCTDADKCCDDRHEITSDLDDVLAEMLDMRNDLVKVQGEMADLQTQWVDPNLEYKTLVVSILFAIPVVTGCLALLCAGWRKNSTPMLCDMCGQFCCLFWICIVAGFIFIFADINQEVCRQHFDVLILNAEDENLTIGDTQVSLFKSAENVLNCGQKGYDDNLVTILHLEDEVDVSDVLDPVIDDLRNETLSLVQTDEINDARTSLSLLNDTLNYNISLYYNLSTYFDEINDVFDLLPSEQSQFNRDDPADQQDFCDAYCGVTVVVGNNVSLAWNWTQYQDAVDDVNAELTTMLVMPPSGVNPHNFTTIQYFTPADMATPTWKANTSDTVGGMDTLDQSGEYANLANYVGLNASVTQAYLWTQALNLLLDANDEAVQNATDIERSLQNIDNSMIAIDNDVDQLRVSVKNIDQNLDDLESAIDQVVNGTEVVIDSLDIIVDYLSDYSVANCDFIGDFYADTILVKYCKDTLGSMKDLFPAMICFAVLWTVQFAIFALFFAPLNQEFELKKHVNRLESLPSPGLEMQQVGGRRGSTPRTYSPRSAASPASGGRLYSLGSPGKVTTRNPIR